MKALLKRRTGFLILNALALVLALVGILGISSVFKEYQNTIISYQDQLMLGVAASYFSDANEYLDLYGATLGSLTAQSRTIEAEKAYLANGRHERVLRVLQFHMARQGGKTQAMAVHSDSGEFIVSTDEQRYDFIEAAFELAEGETGVYFTDYDKTRDLLSFIMRSENGIYYMAMINVESLLKYAIADKIATDKSSVLLIAPERETTYYKDNFGVKTLDREGLARQFGSTAIDVILKKSSESPDGFFGEILPEGQDSQSGYLIGGANIDLDSGRIILTVTMRLDDVTAPVISAAVKVVFAVIALLAGLLALLWNLFYTSRSNKIALREISALQKKSAMLEEVNRREQELSHNLRLMEIGSLTSSVAHEVNNLLTPIMGYSMMLLNTLPEESTEFDYALEVYSASEKARDIIRRINYLSKKNLGFTLGENNLEQIINLAIRTSMVGKVSGIELVKELNCPEATVRGNETYLMQVFLNILINAAQAMEKSGGKIYVSTSIDKGFVNTEIEDTGPGIPETVKRHIFEPFFTTKENSRGTGLGLSIAKKIVDEHSGQISVTDKVDGGTVFRIRLPLYKERVEEAE